MVAAAISTVLMLLISHNVINDRDGVPRILMALTASLPWLVGVTLAVRAGHYERVREHTLSLLVLAIAVTITCFGPSSVYPWAMMHMAGLFYLTVAPYAQRRNHDLVAPCHYHLLLVVSFLFTGLSVLIFCLGIDAILASLNYLFNIKINHKLYFDVWIVGVGLLGVSWFTTSITQSYLPRNETIYPRWAYFIVTYLLVPLLAAYMLILYAYGLKILLAAELPKGRLGIMISMFGLIGVLTHYLAVPLSTAGKSVLAGVARWFYPALIAPLLLLWYAIYTRVSAYGITEDRYLLIMGAVWFSLLIIGHALRPARMWLATPLLGCALLMVASFGPWGAVSVSTASQLHELRGLLVKTGVMVDGKVTPLAQDTTLDMDDKARIANIVRYFAFSNKTDALRPLLPRDLAGRPNRWEAERLIMPLWGLTPVNSRDQGQPLHFNYHRNLQEELQDIADFDVATGELHRYLADTSRPEQTVYGPNNRLLKTFVRNEVLEVSDASGRMVTFNLNQMAEKLIRTVGSVALSSKDYPLMEAQAETDGFVVRLQLRSLNATYKDDKPTVTNASYVLYAKF